MASIDKRPNGKWRARWREYPGGPQKTRTFSRKIDASDFLASIEHGIRSGTYVDPTSGKITFGEWWPTIREARHDLRASSVVRDDTYYRTHIAPRFAAIPLTAIDRPMLRAWVAELVEKGLAPKTVRHAFGLVRQSLDMAVEDRVLSVNPAYRFRGLPVITHREMTIATTEDIATLAERIDPRYRTWLLTAAYSGLRFGELVALQRQSLDLEAGRIRVGASTTEVRGKLVTGMPKTNAGVRTVPIPAPVVTELARHCEGQGASDLVFQAPEGGPMRRSVHRRRVWIPATVAAGLGELGPSDPGNPDSPLSYSGLRVHDLRHSAVTHWISTGANIKQLTKWAGHSSVSTLIDRYGHLLETDEAPVMEALSSSIAAAKPRKIVALVASA